MVTTSRLEQEYEESCLRDVVECKRLGYNPGYYLRMCEEYGAVETARRLINSDKWADGFTRLYEMGRLDLTLEAHLYENPRFQPLFDAQTVANAERRLESVGYIKRDGGQ